MAEQGGVTVNRSVEIRAVRRGDIVTVFRWQSHGEPIVGHRNDTIALKAAIDRRAQLFAQLDRENAA
jgi:hypothetical protein